jgi:hypothetical protein
MGTKKLSGLPSFVAVFQWNADGPGSIPIKAVTQMDAIIRSFIEQNKKTHKICMCGKIDQEKMYIWLDII